jgi:hypothetical protein
MPGLPGMLFSTKENGSRSVPGKPGTYAFIGPVEALHDVRGIPETKGGKP